MASMSKGASAPRKRQALGRLFQRAARAQGEHMLRKLAACGHAGLTLFHTALITNLDADGTRLTTMAERAGMSKQSMGQLARELERRGYISRTPDPKDKRAFLIRFTNRGRRLLADARSAKDELEAEYAALLGRKRLDTLWELLQALVEHEERGADAMRA